MTEPTKPADDKAQKPVTAKPAAEKAAQKPREPRTYKAPHDVYVDGEYHRAGKPFVTAAPKGKQWERVGQREKAATEAADPAPGGDPDYTKLDPDQLLVVLAAKEIDPGPVKDKEGLLAILKAESKPNG
jgi:hypothetical protein